MTGRNKREKVKDAKPRVINKLEELRREDLSSDLLKELFKHEEDLANRKVKIDLVHQIEDRLDELISSLSKENDEETNEESSTNTYDKLTKANDANLVNIRKTERELSDLDIEYKIKIKEIKSTSSKTNQRIIANQLSRIERQIALKNQYLEGLFQKVNLIDHELNSITLREQTDVEILDQIDTDRISQTFDEYQRHQEELVDANKELDSLYDLDTDYTSLIDKYLDEDVDEEPDSLSDLILEDILGTEKDGE